MSQNEIVELLNCTFDEKNRNLILSFASDMSRPHDKEILLLPPLYFSSICENNCQYCDFSSNGNRLSYDDFLDEFDFLTDLGYRSIELVSSQDIDHLLLYWPLNNGHVELANNLGVQIEHRGADSVAL